MLLDIHICNEPHIKIKKKKKKKNISCVIVCIIAIGKMLFQPKSVDIVLISPQKHMLWYLLEVPL